MKPLAKKAYLPTKSAIVLASRFTLTVGGGASAAEEEEEEEEVEAGWLALRFLLLFAHDMVAGGESE